jgi:hypothetical protein
MSDQRTIMTPTASAVITPAEFNASGFSHIVVTASTLQDEETVVVSVGSGALRVAMCDADGNAIELSASSPSRVLPGGPMYYFQKNATADPCGVFAWVS